MARRVLALWLPGFPTDRLRRVRAARGESAPRDPRPLVTVLPERGRTVLAAVDPAAAAGLAPGMALADARALEPGLEVVPADPEADATALDRLADWCGRWSPWTTATGALAAGDPRGDAGVLIDLTGCAHLFGGEAAVVADLAGRLARFGYAARIAVADTAGAAWAVARTGPGHGAAPGRAGDPAAIVPGAIVPLGGQREALAPLPLAGLGLEPATVIGLNRAGLYRIGDLYPLPRAGLAARFGPGPLDRLDRALGRTEAPLSPRRPAASHAARLVFAEPIGRTEDVAAALDRLLGQLCADLERDGLGARQVELALYRVDGSVARLAVGTGRPNRRPKALARLFAHKLDGLDAGFGIEVAVLGARRTDRMDAAQLALERGAGSGEGAGDPAALDDLIDRLDARLADRPGGAVFRPVPRQSWVPERAVARVLPAEPLAGKAGGGRTPHPDGPRAWPGMPAAGAPGGDGVAAGLRPRPLRLLDPPRPVEAVAPIPDDPPVMFRWRGRLHRVARADGPERIGPEWWTGDTFEPRDYYRVETTDGRRFWLYRTGLHTPEREARWYVQGMFC